jgi:ectoine hydroxylase-related dioxygenase (phytanoyl-CoA dioxygenase family)
VTGTSSAPALDDSIVIDAAKVGAFERDGHVRVNGLATGAEVAAFRPAIEAATEQWAWDKRPLEERDTYGKAFLQAANLWRRDPVVARFTLARRFARAAAQLLGVDGVRLYHDQALFKEAGGGHTPWHQDHYYWPLEDDATITMWMALAPITPPQYGMTFASGTHLLGDLCGPGISDESDEQFASLARARGWPLVTYTDFAPGDATFHAGWTLHSAPPNPIEQIRPVMTVIYVSDGSRVAAPTNPNQENDLRFWLKGHQPGDLVGGDRNPRIG